MFKLLKLPDFILLENGVSLLMESIRQPVVNDLKMRLLHPALTGLIGLSR